ncbi:PfkB family carbohydrate kinase [Trichocoleus sp. FACHB-262]|uniref:carbohydrate kinase family protein n=1 Tax=Trichocoleus sp. FACHB-262 TaxID=2692869 RepID=UPI0016839D61|nr:PfkB family carbohydrate kinase [Trichocoleus sp. FACHB-262]MBD2124700.1 carbohydrate kinase [Trichocoleus sp. FACHB-262]
MVHPRVLCLGEVLFDCLANQPGRSLEQVESWTPYPGGAPANVACALVKLGTTAGFVGCVGQDEPGANLVQLLQTVGVDTKGVQRHPTAPTRQVYVLRSETGDRIFSGFGDLDTAEFADTHLQADQLPVELFESADFLVLGTLELAYPESRAATERALQLAEQHYVKTLVDVNWRPMFWPDPEIAPAIIQDLLKRVDFLKLADEEAEWLFGTADPGAIAHRLGNTESVLVTAGAKGCAYYLGGHEGHLNAFDVESEDTTGAGDSFVAGFLHQVAQNGLQSLSDPETAKKVVTYASAVGALTTTRPGAIAAQPTPAEVEAFLYLNQQLSG